MEEDKKVGYLYCEEITEEEIQKYLNNRFNGYVINKMNEEDYDIFRERLWAVNVCLGSDLESLIGFEEETLYAKMKQEIQLEVMEAIRVNSIMNLADMAVSLLDSE